MSEPVDTLVDSPVDALAPPSCSVCAAPLRAGVRFCASCGAFVGRPSATMAIASEQPADVGLHGGGLTAVFVGFFAVLGLSASLVLKADVSVALLRSSGLLIVGFGVFGYLIHRRANMPTLRLPSLRPGPAALVLLGTLAFAVGMWLLGRALPETWFIDETSLHRAAGAGLLLLLFDFAVLPAIGEELLFRGVILSGLRGSFRDHTAAVICALLFATIHISPISFPHLALLGYVLARVRLKTGSIWPCVVIHGLFNTTLLVLSWTIH